MALAAIRFGRTLSLVRAFASSRLTSPSTASLVSGSDSSGGAGLSHLFGYSHLHGFEKPCSPWRHLVPRSIWNWTELKDCKHWLITFNFPKDPAPTREEMIETYVKSLATVLGSEEEAKKKIYGLSTTTYTGFQCNVDEATSEKLKDHPLVTWVLPDGCGELGIITGDKYENGVITPDPNPPKPYNERPRNRNNDRMGFERQRDFRPMEGRRNMPSEHRDNRYGDNYNNSSTERRNSMQGDQFDHRPPFEQRNPVQGQGYQRDQFDRRPPFEPRNPVQGQGYQRDQFDRRPPIEPRNPVQGYQRENTQPDDQRDPILPIDRRDSYQGKQSDIPYEGQREAVQRGGEGRY